MRKHTLAALMLIMAFTMLCGSVSARKQPVPKLYMFGVAASFTDTIVHFTSIQQIDSAWIDTKSKFLQDRQAYSYQLRDYLSQHEQMNHRTCMVFYAMKKEKLEKKYQKMRRLYGKDKHGVEHFDVRYIMDSDFKFQPVKQKEEEKQDE